MIYYVVRAAYDGINDGDSSTQATHEGEYITFKEAFDVACDLADNAPRPDLEIAIYDERGTLVTEDDFEDNWEPCPECHNKYCTCYNNEEQ